MIQQDPIILSKMMATYLAIILIGFGYTIGIIVAHVLERHKNRRNKLK